ncbi:MAG: hypothetical protein RLY70_4815 [Planctomycetota bacterium]
MRLSALSRATGRTTDKISVVHGENECRPESAGWTFVALCLYDGHLVRRRWKRGSAPRRDRGLEARPSPTARR